MVKRDIGRKISELAVLRTRVTRAEKLVLWIKTELQGETNGLWSSDQICCRIQHGAESNGHLEGLLACIAAVEKNTV